MTQPVQEPTQGRTDSGQEWRTRQLFRRPAPSIDAVYPIKVFGDTQAVTTGDGKFIMLVTSVERIAGLNLIGVAAYVTTVSSSGLPTVQIRNITQAVDMLTTKITIDVSEFSSDNAATQPVIDTANDDIALGDRIAIDVDVAGTGAKGLGVILVYG